MSIVAPPPQDELELLIREARARQRRRWMAAAAVVAAVTAAAIAAYSVVSTGPNRAARARSAVPVGASECRGDQLAISFVHRGAVMGQEGGLLRFTNVGRAACRISGWPRVAAITSEGRTVRASRSLQSMLFATFWLHLRPVPRLTLRQGVSGYAVLGGADNPAAAGRESPTWQCPVARRLMVSPPGGSRQVPLSGLLWTNHSYPPTYLPLCGGRPWIEPIRPRPHFSS